MLKKFFTLLLLIVFSLAFFIQPINIFADDEETNLTELISESVEDGGDQSGSEFDTSNYKTYNNRGFDDDEFDDKYFYTPLKKVTKVNGEFPPGQTGTDPTQVYKEIREELAKTGYEAYCMVENVKIDPKYNTGKLIDIYLEYHPNGTNLPTVSTEILATDNAEYPIWRDVDDKQFLMTSLEEYFGFKDVIEKDPALSEINTAPINSLLSQKQACVQGWESLAAQRRACNKLEENKECALTKRRVPGTGYETHDLMGMTADFYTDHGTLGGWAKIVKKDNERPSTEGCEILFADPKNAEKELNSVEKSLRDSIINVPTYHDQSYRLGFIIAAIETRYPAVTNPSATKADIIFNFFTPKTQNMKVDEVLVTAFKLPDIGTNKGPKSNWGHEEWNDPLDLTRLALTTKENQQTHDEERQDKRSFVLSAAESAVKQTEDSRIYCIPEKGEEGPNSGNGAGLLPGPGTNTCLVPLPRALVDIVNGNVTNESCENKTETIEFISDLAGLRSPSDFYGREFNSEFGGQVLLNLFFGSVYNANGESPGYAEVDFDSIWSINKDTWKPTTPNSLVHFYLVYPMGFELGTVEEAIKGTFFSTEQIANMNEDKSIVNVFEMTGQAQTLNGGKVNWEYEDKDWKLNNPGDCNYKTIELPDGTIIETDIPIICKEKPSIKIVQGGGKVDILGGRLSWWLRKVQISLSSSVSFAHRYYESCRTMEEFLLGKCGGGITGGEVDPQNVASVAVCLDGSPRITAGETAEHISIIGTGACAGKPTMAYSPLIHNIPNWKDAGDYVPECDEALYSYIACTYPETLIANPVNDQGQFIASGNMTACEFVVKEAKRLGISPRFALSMWGEETGFSHYKSSNGAFGIHPGVADPFHLGEQLSALAETMFGQFKYQSFLEKYSAEVIGSNQFCTNPEFPARLATYYYYMAPW